MERHMSAPTGLYVGGNGLSGRQAALHMAAHGCCSSEPHVPVDGVGLEWRGSGPHAEAFPL
eukprot:366106-Chlamydomonas_euryale.AAC.8